MLRNRLKTYSLLAWYKNLREERIKSLLIKTRGELNHLVKKKESLLVTRKYLFENLKNSSFVSSEVFKTFFENLEYLFIEEERLTKQIQEKRKELEEIYRDLIRAYQERRTVEVLRDKTKKNILTEETLRFYKEMDDMVLSKK